MGITSCGRVAVLTNFTEAAKVTTRDNTGDEAAPPSRGELTVNFLKVRDVRKETTRRDSHCCRERERRECLSEGNHHRTPPAIHRIIVSFLFLEVGTSVGEIFSIPFTRTNLN